ncbi:MAG: DUF86 domain-containing protein [Culturomica sp.]|jgi:uncharacterized protein with HEPN domain|nr:DUF86 domain-containing protein [Culturomica sp.]
MKQQHNILKCLVDIRTSIDAIEEYLGLHRDFNIYLKNRMLRSAIERELSIIGEAMNRINQLDPHYPILNTRKIIALRNRVVHAYDGLDNETIWSVLVNHLPKLKEDVAKLLG